MNADRDMTRIEPDGIADVKNTNHIEDRETMNSETDTLQIVENADNEGLGPVVGDNLVIGYVDEINGRGAEEVQGYPLTRAELLALARYWERQLMDTNVDIYTDNQIGGSECRLLQYATQRLNRIADIVGTTDVRKAVDEVAQENHQRDGYEIWDAWRKRDKHFDARLRKRYSEHGTHVSKILQNKAEAESALEYLRNNPFGYKIDDSDNLWTLVWAEDGKRLLLNVRTLFGWGIEYPEYSIEAPQEWTSRFNIHNSRHKP